MSVVRRFVATVGASAVVAAGLVSLAPPAHAAGEQPVPGHTSLVPSVPRKDTPKVNGGEIWDIEVVGNRVFVAGGFTSLTNKTGTNNTVNQAQIAAYNLDTGRIDETFRPTVNGSVAAVEASPDGTKLYIGGAFSAVNGVAKKNFALLNITTGAPVATFAANASSKVDSLAATNTTLYVGGRFTKINGVSRTALAAVNGATGAVDAGFVNNLSGGIGVDGALTVQQLRLTHDNSTLVAVHTGRRMNDQDRYGVAMVDVATKQMLPWSTRLWQDNLSVVGGIQRAYGMDISPDDSYFVVTSGSGGDRPPINDTAVAFTLDGGADMQPRWITRNFDSTYSVAITEVAVYLGGHFNWTESPTSPDPWPGLDNVGYGWGQGLSGYALGDDVVRREHLTAISPVDGRALPWNPGSSSFEGCKAMTAYAGGLVVGCDGNLLNGVTTGRTGVFAYSTVPAPSSTDTTIDTPIEGRVVGVVDPFTVSGTATAPGTLRRVEVSVQDRDSKQYLQDDLVTWAGTSNTINATTLGAKAPGTNTAPWSMQLTIPTNRRIELQAKTFASSSSDQTKAVRRMETFGVTDQLPNTGISTPAAGLVNTLAFTVTGTATDDLGVNAISLWFRDESNRYYLQDDGTTGPTFNTFRIQPDVVGATNATWQYDVVLPKEGVWRGQASAIDNNGQEDLRGVVRDWTVTTTGAAPRVTITSPVVSTPPTVAQPITMAPGGPVTFSGTASDESELRLVEVQIRNLTTLENLANDGSYGPAAVLGWHRVSPQNLSASTYDWTWTTPFNLAPGVYSFAVRATDDLGTVTSTTYQGRLTINALVPGDTPPDTTLAFVGTDMSPEALHLDLSGTALDATGVSAVHVGLREVVSNKWLTPAGTLADGYSYVQATLAAPGATTTGWTLPVDLPRAGRYAVTAWAVDTAGQRDISTTGATGATYYVFPGDADPSLHPDLQQPLEGSAYTESRILVTGRALDDVAIQNVRVRIKNSLGQYMTSSGTFGATETWIASFMTSPGSTGSQYSYTSPILPAGAYKVAVRPEDNNGQYPLVFSEVNVTVSAPAGNAAPVASATVSCTQNVCSFDGSGSTDEHPETMTYAWAYGNGRTGTGAVPTTIYFAPGTFAATLTVRDEYGATGTATVSVTITEPPTNVAPSAVISPPSCAGLACNFSARDSIDTNTGDVVTYAWNFGDGSTSTSVAPARTYLAAGTYTVTLTVTDGWGKSSTATTTVTVAP